MKDRIKRMSLELPFADAPPQAKAATAPKHFPLGDEDARRIAMASHDRSLLVEAGAGSGKTALMAGRIALMMASGTHPKHIAAVTFTELAASELLLRVRGLVNELLADRIPIELRIALPQGLSAAQRAHLSEAANGLDEITCSTIHGFCQRLIKPYPVEADIDPGAAVMDNEQANRVFSEITEGWLRTSLDGETGGLLAEMVLQNPGETLGLIQRVLEHLRNHRTLAVPASPPVAPLIEAFQQAAQRFAAFLASDASEPETAVLVDAFVQLAENLQGLDPGRPADLVRLLLTRPSEDLFTAADEFKAYKKKGKWQDAAKRAGLSKLDGDRLNSAASEHYERCCGTWVSLHEAAATQALGDLVQILDPVMDRFRDYKRGAALLDFNDLIFAARSLLRDHEPVRQALAERFARVLVDEFQDTDPLQTEIFWRLCGEPSAGSTDWIAFKIRPGALFLVGDPKQAIYRFRGADVAAYIQAREALQAQSPDAVLSISTNFRSRAPILAYVNDRFEPVLSEKQQPGFTALNPFHADRDSQHCVAALDITVVDEDGKASIERQRDREAEAVAELCARLIGHRRITDRRSGETRPCRPGDIALLAPTGSDLWRYEEALEGRGIAVATQAGKGLYRRQEIQDLIALTRALADRRDTLALGALLRGPLVGLTEEQLLDLLWALPHPEDGSLPRLDLGTPLEPISHPVAHDTLQTLQILARKVHSTTPHDLLSQAIDALRVRPILLQRHRGQAERALANVDLYLNLSRQYAVRGLRAFAEAMTAAWTDESKAVEGRPDAQEEAVALYTMHAAKGLEWPIVIPVNTMTQINAPESAVRDRSGHFHCPILGVRPKGYGQARDAERAELNRERIRLWYVAATRARDLLVLPRLDIVPKGSAWISLMDFGKDKLPALDLEESQAPAPPSAAQQNLQTREIFRAEAGIVVASQHHIQWLSPSREEDANEDAAAEGHGEDAEAPQGEGAASADSGRPVLRVEEKEILIPGMDGELSEQPTAPDIQGGRERGIILHKLLEEVLTGETLDDGQSLSARAAVLIEATGLPVATQSSDGLVPTEIASSVNRALSLPEVHALRPRLLPEFPVYACAFQDGEEQATVGIADAIAFDEHGQPQVIIDWKSDVSPDEKTIEHYKKQVGAYLEMTGTPLGLIVLATTGRVIQVTAPARGPGKS